MATYSAPATFDEFVKQYDHFITVTIYRVSRGSVRSAELEDLKQAVYTRAVEKDYLAGYSPEKGSFSTYLFWLIRSVVVNQFDKNTRNPLNMAIGTRTSPEMGFKLGKGWTRTDSDRTGRLVLEAHADFQDTTFERRQVTQDVLARLDQCVRELQDGEDLSAVLRLLYEGFEPREIARRIGRTSAVVKEYRKTLQALLQKQLGEHVA